MKLEWSFRPSSLIHNHRLAVLLDMLGCCENRVFVCGQSSAMRRKGTRRCNCSWQAYAPVAVQGRLSRVNTASIHLDRRNAWLAGRRRKKSESSCVAPFRPFRLQEEIETALPREMVQGSAAGMLIAACFKRDSVVANEPRDVVERRGAPSGETLLVPTLRVRYRVVYP